MVKKSLPPPQRKPNIFFLALAWLNENETGDDFSSLSKKLYDEFHTYVARSGTFINVPHLYQLL